MAKTDFKSVDEYISSFPDDVQIKLQEIRKVITEHIPSDAQEVISYQIPTVKLNGNLVHFAANKNHIGFYPTPKGVKAFSAEFDRRGFKWSKGAVQFPVNELLPLDLISDIVEFRVKESLSGK